MSTSVSPNNAPASVLLGENIRIYLEVQSAFEQCDPEIQEALAEMFAIVRDPESSREEVQMAMDTILEGLFPGMSQIIW